MVAVNFGNLNLRAVFPNSPSGMWDPTLIWNLKVPSGQHPASYSPVHQSLHLTRGLLSGPRQVPWLRLTGGGLGADGHTVHLFQVAEVHSDVAEHLGAELAAHKLPGPGIPMVQPHMRAQAAPSLVHLSAEPAAVGPAVRGCARVLAEVLLAREGVVTHVALVPSLPEAGKPISEGRVWLWGLAVLLPVQMVGGQGVIERHVSQAPGWRGLEGGWGQGQGWQDRDRFGHDAPVFFHGLRFLVPGFLGLTFDSCFAVFTTKDTFPPFPLKCQKFVWALAFSSSSLRCLTVQFCFMVKVGLGGLTEGTVAGALPRSRWGRSPVPHLWGRTEAFRDGGRLVSGSPEPREGDMRSVHGGSAPVNLRGLHSRVGQDGQFTSGDGRGHLDRVSNDAW